jgi:hypothetical protein
MVAAITPAGAGDPAGVSRLLKLETPDEHHHEWQGFARRQYVWRLHCLSQLQSGGEYGDAKRGDRCGAVRHHRPSCLTNTGCRSYQVPSRLNPRFRSRARRLDCAVRTGLRQRWRSIVERAVRAHGFVVAPPGLDQHVGFGQAEEQFAIEKFTRSLLLKLSQWRR